MYVDALQRVLMSYGIDEKSSKEIVIAMIRGSLCILENSVEDNQTLVDSVCSKKGTTIEAVNYLRSCNFEQIIIEKI